MADVSIQYKGNTIAEMNETGTKTIETSGTYCEDDIKVNYTPNSKTYEITLANSSGWVLLTTLDDEVLEHINDESLFVSLVRISAYEYSWYSGMDYFVGNRILGYHTDNNPVYGSGNRMQSETQCSWLPIPRPANSTDDSNWREGEDYDTYGFFRVTDGKYYIRPGDGFICAGTYSLTFSW
jgi:hypothetical protein